MSTSVKDNKTYNNPIIPVVIAICIILGIVIGIFFASRFSGNRLNVINSTSSKLTDLLYIVDDQYVDTVNIQEIVENAIPGILKELDPHSSYVTAKDAKTANDDLNGSFSGIGVQFTIKNDTVYITNIIKDGPSEKVGILPGDRIIAIDGKPYVGDSVTNEETMHKLKGPKNTTVEIQVLRRGEKKDFKIVRGDIPVQSVEASYMLTDELGYIYVKNFGQTTHIEFLSALDNLRSEGFKGLVIDLRNNGGGYMQTAIQMVNEFLPKNKLIVYTKGRCSPKQEYVSDGWGSFQKLPVIVLTNEYTASASEIFAGAIQDNDRGIIVGRRTFGKGLVQQPIDFNDGSVINLTIARYYTPSGRCIQKPYQKGQAELYETDLLNRYDHGEFFNEDSIKQTGEKYKTSIGRIVYGGGGIMPDYFVAEDTTEFSSYYKELATKGIISEFCFEYTDKNRARLSDFSTYKSLLKHLQSQHLVEQCAKFADSKGIARRNNMIIQSRRLFERSIYGSIIYNMLDVQSYMQYVNSDDVTINKAIELFKDNKTTPQKSGKNDVTDEKGPSKKKKASISVPSQIINIGRYGFC